MTYKHSELTEHLGVAAREHKSPGPKTSGVSGPHSLRITRRSGPDYVRMGPHYLRTARKHPLRTRLMRIAIQIARVARAGALGMRSGSRTRCTDGKAAGATDRQSISNSAPSALSFISPIAGSRSPRPAAAPARRYLRLSRSRLRIRVFAWLPPDGRWAVAYPRAGARSVPTDQSPGRR